MTHKPTTLTDKQKARRRQGIGASEAKIIMAGDWLELWEEKTGRREPADLSDVLRVQMGIATEGLNRWWYEQRTGIPVLNPDKTLVHPVHSWMLCHLDGAVLIGKRRLPWEAKHTNPFDPVTKVVETYYAQLQHQMEVAGEDEARLSVFYGNSKWAEHIVKRDVDYISELLMREEQFWWHVQNDKRPPGGIVIPVAAPKVEEPRVVDMTTGNQAGMWKDNADTWLKYRQQVKASDAAEKSLKGMVPDDAGLVHGDGVVIAKAANGNLSLREPTKKDRERIDAAKENRK